MSWPAAPFPRSIRRSPESRRPALLRHSGPSRKPDVPPSFVIPAKAGIHVERQPINVQQIVNQLTQKTLYSKLYSSTIAFKWLYTYDANGNVLTVEKQNAASVKQEKWVYTWNVRDQMTKAEKFTGTGDAYAGKVVYEYCLVCGGALSKRKAYSLTVSSNLVSERRYEYDGLNLVRADDRVDTDNDGVLEAGENTWRCAEVATHKPGALGAQLGKRVYLYPNGSSTTPSSTTDYLYVHDAVGNVVLAAYDDNDEGEEAYYFVQEAFGNEVSVGVFAGSSWSTARAAGITEHQTGKWIDPFTGLYYFDGLWIDSTMARIISRFGLSRPEGEGIYTANWLASVGSWGAESQGSLRRSSCSPDQRPILMEGDAVCWTYCPNWVYGGPVIKCDDALFDLLDPCAQICILKHEQVHVRQLSDCYRWFNPSPYGCCNLMKLLYGNRFECEAYRAEANCLLHYLNQLRYNPKFGSCGCDEQALRSEYEGVLANIAEYCN